MGGDISKDRGQERAVDQGSPEHSHFKRKAQRKRGSSLGAHTPSCDGRLNLERSQAERGTARPTSVRAHSHNGSSHPNRAKVQSPHKSWQRATRPSQMPSLSSQPSGSPDLTCTCTHRTLATQAPSYPGRSTHPPQSLCCPPCHSSCPPLLHRKAQTLPSKQALPNPHSPPYLLSSAHPCFSAVITTSILFWAKKCPPKNPCPPGTSEHDHSWQLEDGSP